MTSSFYVADIDPSDKWSAVKGINSLTIGTKPFLLEKIPFPKGGKTNLTELHPLKVYLFLTCNFLAQKNNKE